MTASLRTAVTALLAIGLIAGAAPFRGPCCCLARMNATGMVAQSAENLPACCRARLAAQRLATDQVAQSQREESPLSGCRCQLRIPTLVPSPASGVEGNLNAEGMPICFEAPLHASREIPLKVSRDESLRPLALKADLIRLCRWRV